jgi:hypothetical protein
VVCSIICIKNQENVLKLSKVMPCNVLLGYQLQHNCVFHIPDHKKLPTVHFMQANASKKLEHTQKSQVISSGPPKSIFWQVLGVA